MDDVQFETPDFEKNWSAIESSLRKRRTFILARRAAFTAAAAAAVAVGVFLNLRSPRLPEIESPVGIAAIGQPMVCSTDTEPKIKIPPIKTLSWSDKAPATLPFSRTSDTNARKSVLQTASEAAESVSEEDSVRTEKAEKRESIADQIDNSLMAMRTAAAADEGEEFLPRRKYGSFSIGASANAGIMFKDRETSALAKTGQYAPGVDGGSQYNKFVPIDNVSNFMPVTAGLNLQYTFPGSRFSLSLGCTYTYLFGRYDAIYDGSKQGRVAQSCHYIGVPLSAYCSILSNKYFNFYCMLGGAVEKGLSTSYDMTDLNGNRIHETSGIKGVQWSAFAGIGFEYTFLKWMGLYLDPRVAY